MACYTLQKQCRLTYIVSLTKIHAFFVNLLLTKQNGLALTMNASNELILIYFSYSGAYWICVESNTKSSIVLNLNGTGIKGTDSDTALSLTKMLEMNTSLTHLDLSNYYHIQ